MPSTSNANYGWIFNIVFKSANERLEADGAFWICSDVFDWINSRELRGPRHQNGCIVPCGGGHHPREPLARGPGPRGRAAGVRHVSVASVAMSQRSRQSAAHMVANVVAGPTSATMRSLLCRERCEIPTFSTIDDLYRRIRCGHPTSATIQGAYCRICCCSPTFATIHGPLCRIGRGRPTFATIDGPSAVTSVAVPKAPTGRTGPWCRRHLAQSVRNP